MTVDPDAKQARFELVGGGHLLWKIGRMATKMPRVAWSRGTKRKERPSFAGGGWWRATARSAQAADIRISGVTAVIRKHYTRIQPHAIGLWIEGMGICRLDPSGPVGTGCTSGPNTGCGCSAGLASGKDHGPDSASSDLSLHFRTAHQRSDAAYFVWAEHTYFFSSNLRVVKSSRFGRDWPIARRNACSVFEKARPQIAPDPSSLLHKLPFNRTQICSDC
jgi:hypothetical protein